MWGNREGYRVPGVENSVIVITVIKQDGECQFVQSEIVDFTSGTISTMESKVIYTLRRLEL